MRYLSKQICTTLLCTISLILAGTQFAAALPDDRLQALEIKAEHNSGDVDGTFIYTGSVVITQGSLRLEADKVTVQLENQTIDCIGQPALFQLNTEEYGLVTGNAENLYFDRSKGQLLISRDAKLTKADGSSTQGDAIIYNINTETWTVEGGTRTVLPPAIQVDKDSTDGDS